MGKVLICCRKTHYQHYLEFKHQVDGNGSVDYSVETYAPTLAEGKRILSEPNDSLLLLDCALPMSMALVCARDDFKIVGFLDMALIMNRQGSFRVYHHKALLRNLSLEVDLYVPSLHSMTTFVACHYLRNKSISWKLHDMSQLNPMNSLNEYERIIDAVSNVADLRTVVWVLDEGGASKAQAQDYYHTKIAQALGSKMEEIRYFGWEEIYGRDQKIANFLNAHVPGMILLARDDQLKDPDNRNAVFSFLKTWRELKRSGYAIDPSKALGPFSWSNYTELLNFTNFTREIFKASDKALEITRPLQVHRDFLDVTPPEDQAAKLIVFRNICLLLKWQISILSNACNINEAIQNQSQPLADERDDLDALRRNTEGILTEITGIQTKGAEANITALNDAIDGLFARTINSETNVVASLRAVEAQALKAKERLYE